MSCETERPHSDRGLPGRRRRRRRRDGGRGPRFARKPAIFDSGPVLPRSSIRDSPTSNMTASMPSEPTSWRCDGAPPGQPLVRGDRGVEVGDRDAHVVDLRELRSPSSAEYRKQYGNAAFASANRVLASHRRENPSRGRHRRRCQHRPPRVLRDLVGPGDAGSRARHRLLRLVRGGPAAARRRRFGRSTTSRWSTRATSRCSPRARSSTFPSSPHRPPRCSRCPSPRSTRAPRFGPGRCSSSLLLALAVWIAIRAGPWPARREPGSRFAVAAHGARRRRHVRLPPPRSDRRRSPRSASPPPTPSWRSGRSATGGFWLGCAFAATKPHLAIGPWRLARRSPRLACARRRARRAARSWPPCPWRWSGRPAIERLHLRARLRLREHPGRRARSAFPGSSHRGSAAGAVAGAIGLTGSVAALVGCALLGSRSSARRRTRGLARRCRGAVARRLPPPAAARPRDPGPCLRLVRRTGRRGGPVVVAGAVCTPSDRRLGHPRGRHASWTPATPRRLRPDGSCRSALLGIGVTAVWCSPAQRPRPGSRTRVALAQSAGWKRRRRIHRVVVEAAAALAAEPAGGDHALEDRHRGDVTRGVRHAPCGPADRRAPCRDRRSRRAGTVPSAS